MDLRRHYPGWDRPFSVSFAEWMATEAAASTDMDEWLVWVPSSRAGRNILNQLFSADPEAVEAFHPPRLLTPAQFVRGLTERVPDAASEVQRLHAWKEAIEGAPAAVIEPVFPVVPSENTDTWAFGIARQLMQLRARLLEDGHHFQSVSAAGPQRDRQRWESLALLEQRYLRFLETKQLTDPDEAIRDGRAVFSDFPWKRLLVAGVLNLSRRQEGLVNQLLENGIPVDFFLPIPETLKESLDNHGRPLPGKWLGAPLPEELVEGSLQRAPEPRQLVGKVIGLAADYGEAIDSLVVGSCESELSRYLIERSRLEPTPFYAPEGKSLIRTEWGRLFILLDSLSREGELSRLSDLLGHSLFRKWALSHDLPVDQIQAAVLELQKTHLLKNIRQLDDPALLPRRAVQRVRDFIHLLKNEGFDRVGDGDLPGTVWSWLAKVANAAECGSDSKRILEQIEEILEDLRSGFDGLALSDADWTEILRFELENRQFYPERETRERPVSGWLELPWETAPHLVILGLPDIQVPGPKSLDSFLTPALCQQLGLYGPDEMAAFHAFRLRLILESRRDWGRVDILLNDRALDDNPVLPSRFLFLADQKHLLKRVDRLLGEIRTEESPLPAAFGSTLQLPEPGQLERVSVTALRAYLQNPFQFYLQVLLKWQPPEPLPQEMDARIFGSLAHSVLESLNTSGEGQTLTGGQAIEAFLLDSLQQTARGLFGSRLPVALQIQLNALGERLRVASAIIAGERQSGWFPELAEWAFHKDIEWSLSGVVLRGKVDLLERNHDTGLYRIIDYKTSDKGENPARSHLTKVTAASDDPLFPECDFADGNQTFRWRDLQLPLYQKAVELHTGEIPHCAYLNLTKAVGDVSLAAWTPGATQREAALRCAEAALERIGSGAFPAGKPGRYRDPWLPWFGEPATGVVDPAWLARHGGLQP